MKHKGLICCLFIFGFLLGDEKQKLPEIPSRLEHPLFIWGFSVEGFPISEKNLNDLENETKISAQCIQFYLQWASEPKNFLPLKSSLEAISSSGAIPCLTWEPHIVLREIYHAIPYDKILKGEYDAYFDHIIKDIKAWNKCLIIRFAHEMNLDKYHWGGNENQFNQNSPEHYIQMFRYVVDYFKKQKVDQVFWAFCPNAESVPNLLWNHSRNYYPGDDYVDILGMDGYNWDITDEGAGLVGKKWTQQWLSFEQIFSKIYQELKDLAPGKPIIVFETASVDRKGGKKIVWIKEAIETAKKWGLMGIIWFQISKEEDWRLNQHRETGYIPVVKAAMNPLQNALKNIRDNKK